jgi:hypothetical protein
LSNNDEYTTFAFVGRTLTSLTGKSLECYTSIKKWDNDYLVVIAKYSTRPTEEEEYIDLIPILKNLYMNVEKFLKPIQKVEVRYA